MRKSRPRQFRSRARACRRDRGASAGFTLFEVLLALMLMAMLAALALPTPHRPAGPLTLRMSAYEVLALLHETRTAAINRGQPTRALVDHTAGAVDGGGRRIVLPPGVAVVLADRGPSQIDFAPDGTSSGGTVVLQTQSNHVAVAVGGETGAIRLEP